MKKIASLLVASLFFYSALPLYAYAENPNAIIIEGWSLEKIANGKKVYRIEADRAEIGNKRIGFFNLGIIKVANLDNVFLTQYNDGRITKKHFDKAVYELNSNCLFDENGDLVFSEHKEIKETTPRPVRQEEKPFPKFYKNSPTVHLEAI